MRRRNEKLLFSYGTLVVVMLLAVVGSWQWMKGAVADGGFLSWRHPWAALLGLASLLLVWCFFHLRNNRLGTFTYSRVSDLAPAPLGVVSKLSALPSVFRIVAVFLFALALAGPQTYKTEVRFVRGIDIMLVLDLSKSMEDRDLRPNRLAAGQCTVHDFLSDRSSDRIGLVVFAKESMLSCPLTLDYESLDDVVADLRIGDVPPLGTAIGDALGLALASLRRSDAKSKVVILVSDGDSNRSVQFEPDDAKQLAVEMGVRVFTVLVGKEKGSRLGFGRHGVDPELLRTIAKDTGGQYFNAGNVNELNSSFSAIRESLEKTEREVLGRTESRELFPMFLIPALILLGLEMLLSLTRWRRFP